MVRGLLLVLLSLSLLASCKKSAGGNCNEDSDCKENLRCVSHQCRRYIDCDLLAKRYRTCINDILTVRDPSYKPTAADKKRALLRFEGTFLKKSKEERCTYDKSGIERCIKKKTCPAFAQCLLNLEQKDTP